MIIEELQGNVVDIDAAELRNLHVETVRLDEQDLRKPVQRVCSDHGHEYGLRLPRGTVLADGDLIARNDHGIVVIKVASTRVIVITPMSTEQMGRVAHALGNRHMPAQFSTRADGTAEMVMPEDHTTISYLRHEEVPFSVEERVLTEPFHHAEHTH